MKRQPAEKDGEHERPFEVLDERTDEGAGRRAVAHYGEGDVAEAVEDKDDREPYYLRVSRGTSLSLSPRNWIEVRTFPRIDVVLIQVAIEPSNGHIICRRQDPRCPDCIVRPDVGDDSDL